MRFKYLFLAMALCAAFPACGGDDDDTVSAAGKGGGSGTGGSSGKGGSSGTAGSGDSGADQGGQTATPGKSASKKVTAADGGDVVLGDATLSIPAGALADDTTVTVETSAPSADLPDATSVKGLLYDFGPDGTEFKTPVPLTLPSAGKPGADEEAVIAWLDLSTNSWQDLATTVNADGSLTADIMHFTTFAVRFNGVAQSDCGFTACGGDVVGTWTVTGVCADATDALNDVCPTAMATLDLTLTGTATFKADGTSETNFTSTAGITYTLSAECLMNIAGGTLPDSCDALSDDGDPSNGDGPTVCTGDPSDSCTCVQTNPEKTDVKTGTYTTDGSTMTTIDDEDGSTDTLEFCVTGKDGRFQGTDGDAVLTWIGTKK